MRRRAETLLFGILGCMISFSLMAQEIEHAPEQPPPVDNSEFFEVATQARITQRFEIYDPHSLEDLQAVKTMGFDQVILDFPNLHSAATNLGLDVVLANWWHQDTTQTAIDEALLLATKVKTGRLRGISMQDEPERNSPDTPFKYYVDLYQQLKPRMTEALSNVQLELSYWGPLKSWDERYYEYFSFLYESCDVMRLMPYPDLHEDALGEVTLMMHRSRRAMRLASVDIPQIVILQTWVLPPENKLPTIPELRVMAYQAMLGGAEVVSFFEYKPELWAQTPGFTDGFRELMRELRNLSHRWSGAELTTVLHTDGILESTAVWPSGGIATITINTNREPTSGLQPLEIRDSSLTPLSPMGQFADVESRPSVSQLWPSSQIAPEVQHLQNQPTLYIEGSLLTKHACQPSVGHCWPHFDAFALCPANGCAKSVWVTQLSAQRPARRTSEWVARVGIFRKNR